MSSSIRAARLGNFHGKVVVVRVNEIAYYVRFTVYSSVYIDGEGRRCSTVVVNFEICVTNAAIGLLEACLQKLLF